jgi:ABC-type spermidine/putrescine transport system permease subunit II
MTPMDFGLLISADAGLLWTDAQLRAYDEALAPILHGVRPSMYAAPFLLVFALICFAPTAVALSRHGRGLKRIAAKNALAPALAAALLFAGFLAPDFAELAFAAILLTVCAGCVIVVSTLIDALIDNPAELDQS